VTTLPEGIKDGDLVKVTLMGRVSNLHPEGKQGPRFTLTAVGRESDGPSPGYASGIYLKDEHVQSVQVLPQTGPFRVFCDHGDDEPFVGEPSHDRDETQAEVNSLTGTYEGREHVPVLQVFAGHTWVTASEVTKVESGQR
jgi:hypothetical protein